MLSILKNLFTVKPDETNSKAEEAAQLSVAFAALLVEAARANENYETHEQELITKLLIRQFDVTPAAAIELRQKGEVAQADAIDLHQFTRSVKSLPADDKVQFIEGLWRIILSDGVRDQWEDSLVRRVCGLIHVTDVESGKARQRVEAERA